MIGLKQQHPPDGASGERNMQQKLSLVSIALVSASLLISGSALAQEPGELSTTDAAPDGLKM